MANALLDKAADPKLKEQVVGGVLQLLLRHEVAGSVDLANSFITFPPPEADLNRERMMAAIHTLVMNAPDAGWRTVWPLITQSDDLGRTVIETVAYGDPGHASFISKLTEEQQGELYLWMVRNYPYAERQLGPGFMNPADTAAMLRDSILEQLKRRGTFAACDAIRHAADELPKYTWLRHHLEEAELLARAATWQPISAKNFLALILDHAKRFVENGEQLIAVLLESLTRLNDRLHDELPAARDLWNNNGSAFWPKDEQDLSDYVARHLDQDLRHRAVIINREVQIRRGTGGGSGQSTDIHVDAPVPGARPGVYERAYVIIETKGIWHTELLTAMRTQLRDRYLKDSRCRDGIYLVGWFACSKWTDDDSRKKKCRNVPVQALRESLEHQARELSVDGYNLKSYVLDASLD